MKRLIFKIQFFALLLLLTGTGCIKKTTVVPQSQRLLPAKDATRADLLQSLQEKSRQIESLKATVSLDLSRGGARSGVLDEYRQTKGYIFVTRPNHIRVQVQMPLVLTTVAVMVSDGAEYRVSIPIKNQYAVQAVDAPVDPKNSLSSLRPQIFLDGLFVDITRHLNKPTVRSFFEEAVVGIRSYYVFSFVDTAGEGAELLEKIWIDRFDLEVARKQIFGEDGRLDTDVEYGERQLSGSISYPKTIVIHRPNEDVTVRMTFQQTDLNQAVEAKAFDLPRPEGAELVQLTKGK